MYKNALGREVGGWGRKRGWGGRRGNVRGD